MIWYCWWICRFFNKVENIVVVVDMYDIEVFGFFMGYFDIIYCDIGV